MHKEILRILVACAVANIAQAAPTESAVREFTLDISRQPIVPMLNQFSTQTGLGVSFIVTKAARGDLLVGPLTGRYTAEAALSQLLADSGLTFSRINEVTIAVTDARPPGGSHQDFQPLAERRLSDDAPAKSQWMRVAAGGAGNAAQAGAHAEKNPAASRDLTEEIVVTAQKRVERLQDVPISITALSGDVIQNASIARVTDLAKLAPNFSFESAFGSADESRVTVRGITGNVRNAGFESGVSVYIDGVYAGRPASQNLNLLNVERVEVLRGPQGTLFGKNTIAGAINVITKKPTAEFEGEVGVNVGNFQRRDFNGYVSGPLVGDQLFFGASFFANDRDGYVKNLFDGRELGSESVRGGDVKLRYVPNSDLEVNVRVDYLKDDSMFVFPETLDGRGHPRTGSDIIAPGIRTTNVDGIPQEQRDVYGASASLDYDLGSHTFTSISAYRRSEYTHSEDNDNSPVDYLLVDGWHEVSRYASQEFRLASPTDRKFDYLVGTYLLWQDVDAQVPFRAGVANAAPGIATVFSNIETRGAAFFGHANYHVGKFTLSAGLRYTRDRKEVKDYHAVGLEAFGGVFNFSRFMDDRTDSDVSPMGSLTFAINDDANVYAKVARGFKSGGWNTDFIVSVDGTPPPAEEIDFDTEHATTYELGFKGVLLDRHLSLNIAAFQTDYEDLQVQSRVFDPRTNLFSFQFNNAASSTIRGGEVEAALTVFDGLSLRAGVGYTEAVYDYFKAAEEVDGLPIDYDGNRLADVPEWNASLMVTYERPLTSELSALVSLDYSFKDSFYTDTANTPILEVDSHSLVGGRLGITSAESYEVFLWGENLLDRDYLVTKQGGSKLRGTWGRPRAYGVQVSYKF